MDPYQLIIDKIAFPKLCLGWVIFGLKQGKYYIFLGYNDHSSVG